MTWLLSKMSWYSVDQIEAREAETERVVRKSRNTRRRAERAIASYRAADRALRR